MASERLLPCPAPSAEVRVFEKLPGVGPGGVTVERYTTAYKTVFEKHTDGAGVVHWFQVVKGA
jgi:hypothetical protein